MYTDNAQDWMGNLLSGALGTLFYGRAPPEKLFLSGTGRARGSFRVVFLFSLFSSVWRKNPTDSESKRRLGLLVSRNWLHSGLVSVSIAARSELKSVCARESTRAI
jgi:hypothetical protein